MQQQGEYVIRPIGVKDYDWLYEISQIVGIGFTSLHADKEYLVHRLETVEDSFKENLEVEKRVFLFVRENLATGELVGLSGIHADVGHKDIFYNYQISTITQISKKLNIYLDHRILNLVNNFQTATELISFWIHPKYRGQNLSKTLSISRFLFLAQFPQWFGKEVIAEIRGVCDDEGFSPFWEAIGRQFFAMDFKHADNLCMTIGKQFIADLIPHEPIYLDLLSPQAQQVVGVAHETAGTARYVLESEGFRFNNYIDIFDGGPLLNVEREKIHSVVNSKVAVLNKTAANVAIGMDALIYNARTDVRMTVGKLQALDSGEVIIADMIAKILDVIPGDTLRYCLI